MSKQEFRERYGTLGWQGILHKFMRKDLNPFEQVCLNDLLEALKELILVD